jgi:hypothetical protein
VWITLHEPDHPEADTRKVSLRIKPTGRRSVTATVLVSRYAPEWSILRALLETLRAMERAQRGFRSDEVRNLLEDNVTTWVEPF